MRFGARPTPSAVAMFERCSNLARWGVDDQAGTLNLVDASAVLRGVQTVRAGEVVPLGRMPTPVAPNDEPDGVVELELFESNPPGSGALDRVTLSPHGFDMTHVDAIGHSFFRGLAYNGRQAAEIFSSRGLDFGGVEALSGGVVTRGVLLDVAEVRGVEALRPADSITAKDLAQAEQAAGASVLSGDAVFVRAGNGGAGPGPDGRRAGLVADAVEWLHCRQVGVYSGDCIERLPSDDDQVAMVLHQVGHVAMGLVILDNPDVGALRSACQRHERRVFLLMMSPLAITGATGCAVNPLAVF